MERPKTGRVFTQRAAIAALILLTFANCGKQKDAYVDPAFATYVSDFENKIDVSTKGITIRFGKTEPPVIGICFRMDESNEVVINAEWWDYMTNLGREQLLFHELGHCAMYLDHDDRRVVVDGKEIQGSIMNSYWFGQTAHYRRYREEYKEALRTNTLINL